MCYRTVKTRISGASQYFFLFRPGYPNGTITLLLPHHQGGLLPWQQVAIEEMDLFFLCVFQQRGK